VTAETPHCVQERLAQAERFWLFLDYDGTLADFAPTPEYVNPDPEIVGLFERLARHPRFRVAVVSGRRLSHVRELVPVPGVLLAGTYGVELLTAGGARIDRLDHESLRPTLDALKPDWADLIAGRQGFFLEDKGWALALHARYAAEDEAGRVLSGARRLAYTAADRAGPESFRLLGGHKFLEIGPRLANKGLTVAYLLDAFPWPRALPIYLGDDDKDEEAFGVVRSRRGIAVVVAANPRQTEAHLRLQSPQDARRWLEMLLVQCG
jgi:trehalose 6-phosphate phosphatase